MTQVSESPAVGDGAGGNEGTEIQPYYTRQDATAQLLAHLHRGGTFAYWWIASEAVNDKGDALEKHTFWWRVENGPLPIPSPTGEHGPRHIYFGVHTSNVDRGPHCRALTETVESVNCLFAELDAKDFDGDKAEAKAHVDGLRPAPSVIIDSGGGFHAYWLLAQPFTLATDSKRQRARKIQARWTAWVGGDPGAKDLARVLRVPGTKNYKPRYGPDFPTVTVIGADFDRLYSLDALERALPEKVQVAPRETNKSNGAAWASAALSNEIATLALTPEGSKGRPGRNTQLNDSAYSLGQIVGAGLLDQGQVERALRATALGIGLGEGEAEATIKSGITAGMREPRGPKDKAGKRQEALPGEETSAATAEPDIKTLLKFGYEDEGNARTVAALHGDKLCHCEAYGWLRYNGRYWERESTESILDGIILGVLKLRRAAAVKAEKEAIVKTAKPSAYRLRGAKAILKSLLTVSVGNFDAGHFHLNCQNGVVDLRTGEVAPHDPAQRFTYCTPVDYDPSASQTIWRDFLRDAIGDGQELQDYVQEAVGYSFTGDTSEEVLFYGFGPRRGGKGCFTETVMTALGRRPLADEVDFATFTAKRKADTQNFDLAGLKPCRFIVASESSKYRQLNAAKVKALTGGNDIRCAHKNKPFFTYRPQFKIWLMSNHPVNADVDDDAAWYRVKVIPFPNSYAGREDKGLKRRLREPGNLRGVLAWAVQGAMAWYSRGSKGLQAPDSVRVATGKARQELDFVAQWIDECIERTGKPEDFMTNAAIYTSYETWAQNNGVTPKKKRSLTTALKRKGLDAGQVKKLGGKSYRGCFGIQTVDIGSGREPEPLNF